MSILLLSFALVLCFYGVSFAEQQVVQNLETKVVKIDPSTIEAQMQQITPLATGASNFGTRGIFTCNTSGVETLTPITMFSEGDDIFFVTSIYCGNVGAYTQYIMLTSSWGGVVQRVFATQGTFSETGGYNLKTRLPGGLPAGVYRMNVVLLMEGNWIITPDTFTFIVV